jgi:GNAT superfamily N-acetyltransferase
MWIETIDESGWERWRLVRLAALRESPHAFSSRLVDWTSAPEGRWRERLRTVALNNLATIGGADVGMVSGSWLESGAEVELISMFVAPGFRGAGVGDALVGSVTRWARAGGACSVSLQVTVGNGAAMRLYRRHGFEECGLDDGEIVMRRVLG